jgi:hypothetical protein
VSVAGALLAADDSSVSPGVLGFLVVAALGVATWLLLRSMRRQMKKIDFDEDEPPRAARPDRIGPTEQATPTPLSGPTTPITPTDEPPGGSVS